MLINKSRLQLLLFEVEPIVFVIASLDLHSKPIALSGLFLDLLLERIKILLVLLLGIEGSHWVLASSSFSKRIGTLWSLRDVVWQRLHFASLVHCLAELLDVDHIILHRSDFRNDLKDIVVGQGHRELLKPLLESLLIDPASALGVIALHDVRKIQILVLECLRKPSQDDVALALIGHVVKLLYKLIR